jgi:hypothetical protein
MYRRNALSLIEVLTAIFIMGLGVISILTLFPLGAMRMAQAFRDERSALAAANADQFMRTYWRQYVVETSSPDPLVLALDNPGGGLPPSNPHEPSYPVFVDPMGYVARNGLPNQNWIGDSPNLSRIPRRTVQLVGSNPSACLALCSLKDGVYFDEGGNPIDRELRYNYLWVIQRPINANRTTAHLTVVVFDRRAPMYAPPRSEQVFHGVNWTPGDQAVVIPGVNSNQLEIRSGDWIVDGTIYDPTSTALGRPGIRHARFYRVTAIADVPNGVQIDLQSPILPPSDNGGPYIGTLIVLRGISGVFVRSPLNGQ